MTIVVGLVKSMNLLTRDEFREQCFKRDNYTCVVPGCGKKTEPGYVGTLFSAHHLIERRLWTDTDEKEGYFSANAALLCEFHHQYGAETCVIQPQVLRKWCGIREVVLPKTWDKTKSYDKWGVQLKRPTRRSIKYPSTPYGPFSPGYDPNDINLPDLKPFLNQPLVVTVKKDGSNAKLTREFVAARNGTAAEHPSFDQLKAEHYKFKDLIPENIIIFSEWLFAVHSIHYVGDLALPSYLQVFGVYDMDTMLFGGWDEVEDIAAKIGYPTVPVIEKVESISEEWRLEQKLTSLFEKVVSQGEEGIVVRTIHPFPYANFEGYSTTNGKTHWKVNSIMKAVRANHVQTDQHWSQQKIVKNEIR